jgi:hypothetical protein
MGGADDEGVRARFDGIRSAVLFEVERELQEFVERQSPSSRLQLRQAGFRPEGDVDGFDDRILYRSLVSNSTLSARWAEQQFRQP